MKGQNRNFSQSKSTQLQQQNTNIARFFSNRVYLAVQLLSATTANAINRLFKDGTDGGDLGNFNDLAELIRLADL